MNLKDKIMKRIIYFILVITLFCGCSEKQKNVEKEGVETILPTEPNVVVSTVKLKKQVFSHEIVSNGKAQAKEYADLYFRTREIIANIYVHNGNFVHQGQKIAELDPFKLKNTWEQRENSKKQANLELQDVLIGQGYAPDKMSAVPEDVMRLAKIKSGYEQSIVQTEAAKRELEESVLTAPYDGIIANLFSKVHNMASTSEAFCRIIRTGNMEVEFSVLESELPLLKIGDKVEVAPYAEKIVLNGNVSEINPIVDKDGIVKVKANVNGGSKLFDGMNVRVKVKRTAGEQLIVPKSAVVLRSGRQVVFVYKDGKANWIYVQTRLENKDEYTIIDGLNEGDEVIISNNVNLADQTPVTLSNK